MVAIKLKAGVVLAGFLTLGGIIIWQGQRVRGLKAENAVLRDQAEQVRSLIEDKRRLAELLEGAAQQSQANLHELAQLRGQQVRRRQIEEEDTRLRAKNNRLEVENGRMLA